MPEPIAVISANDASMSVPEPGLRRQVMSFSPGMMLVRHRMEKGWVGVLHSHPHEQMVYVVSGHLQFREPNGTFEARSGDCFLVAGDVPHQAKAFEDSEVLDIFAPYREDYASGS